MCKLKLILYIFFSIHFIVYGQDFAPVGATWHYSYTETSPPFNQNYILIESVKDTIILGKNAKKLNQTLYQTNNNSFFWGHEFIYSDSNKVYLYKYNKFNLLYDFNAVQGDTIFVIEPLLMNCGGNGDTLIPFLIDSVKLVNINGFQKKVQHVTNLEMGWNFGEKFIESIGSNYFLFPTDCVAPPNIDSLRCYNDSILNYHLVNDCEEIITSIKENTNIFHQYEFQNTIYNTLNLPDIKGDILIYDIQGKLLFSEKIKPTIPIDLKNGIYIVLLKNKDFQHIYKILKL